MKEIKTIEFPKPGVGKLQTGWLKIFADLVCTMHSFGIFCADRVAMTY